MSPQKENGYTPLANEIIDALIGYPLPGAQMQCLLLIIRKTYGYNKKYDHISLSQFIKFTGIRKRNVIRAIDQLIKKKVVFAKKGGVKNDTVSTSKYWFNKHFEQWERGVKIDTGGVKRGKKGVSNLTHTKDIIQKTYTDKLKTFVGNYINFISKTYPTKQPRGKNLMKESLDTVDKLIRLDGFDEEYIFESIRWAQKDDFWKSQIYSLSGLRTKKPNGLTKFQNLSNAFDKDQPEKPKQKIPVFRIVNDGS